MTLGSDSISNTTCTSIRTRLSKTISFWCQLVRVLKQHTSMREPPRPQNRTAGLLQAREDHCIRGSRTLTLSVRGITWDETSPGLWGMEVPVNSCVAAPVNLPNIHLHHSVISWQPNTILPCHAHSSSKHWTLTLSVIWDRTNFSIFVVFQCTLYAPKMIYRHWNMGKTPLISSLHTFGALNIIVY